MRYCNHCRRITTGEPLFCQFCGRSYDLKLCPHRHPNPRTAEVCSQCGSRELTTPHPKVPLTVAALLAVLSMTPGVLLLLLTVVFLLAFLRMLFSSPQLMSEFMAVGLIIAILWWLYLQLPNFLRRWLSKLWSKGDRHEH